MNAHVREHAARLGRCVQQKRKDNVIAHAPCLDAFQSESKPGRDILWHLHQNRKEINYNIENVPVSLTLSDSLDKKS